MRRGFLLLAVCLGLAGFVRADESAAPQGHPDSAQWDSLFAADLSDALYTKGVWSVENGELTATRDECIWSQKQYENFIIDLEFKNSPAANSGVLVYATDAKNWVPNSVEIQILDDYDAKWASAPKNWQCGGVFGHLAPAKQVVKKAGEWNRMTITCQGQIISVVLNGQPVAQLDMKKWTSARQNPDGSDIPPWLSRPLAEMATQGQIGLQGKHGGAPIYFRNVKIKQISE